ncbi:hypothetical protein CPB86DRAFT_227965 [Serendipita vermifera]|nr:hypothetical protein CPB86DRAFT_227965 [Serendipita vermifera]
MMTDDVRVSNNKERMCASSDGARLFSSINCHRSTITDYIRLWYAGAPRYPNVISGLARSVRQPTSFLDPPPRSDRFGHSCFFPSHNSQMSADALPALDLNLYASVTLSRYFTESHTVWKARWTWTKALYYINRVITVFGLTLAATRKRLQIRSRDKSFTLKFFQKILSSGQSYPSDCSFYLWTASLLQVVSWCIANIILTLRIVALYYQRKYLLRVLYFLLVVDWAVVVSTTIHTLWSLEQQLDYSPVLRMCASTAPTPAAPAIFMGPAIYEFILFILTIYRALQDVRNRLSTGPLVATLYRDGFYYFASIFTVHLWNSLSYMTQPMTGIFMGVYFAWAVMTVMSCRVFLNLVFVLHGRPNAGMTSGVLTSFHARAAPRTEVEMPGQVETFGSKKIRHNVPLTVFSTTVVTVEGDIPRSNPRPTKGSSGLDNIPDPER